VPCGFIEEVNKLVSDFVWNKKPPKIKKSTMIGDKSVGGMSLPDLPIIEKALKIMWVKRLLQNSDKGEEMWKIIPELKLKRVGGPLIFRCNYEKRKLNLEPLADFYDKVIEYWESFCQTSPVSKEDILNQILWNNRFIVVKNKSLYFPKWHNAGIMTVRDITNDQGEFLAIQTMQAKFNLDFIFLEYLNIINSIPFNWKSILREPTQSSCDTRLDVNELINEELSKLTCSKITKILVEKQFEPPTSQRKLVDSGISKDDLHH